MKNIKIVPNFIESEPTTVVTTNMGVKEWKDSEIINDAIKWEIKREMMKYVIVERLFCLLFDWGMQWTSSIMEIKSCIMMYIKILSYLINGWFQYCGSNNRSFVS